MAGERIELTVPARPGYARTVRVTAATLASRLGMSIDDVDDVRIALEEAFLLASSRAADDAEVTFVFDVSDDRMEVCVGPLSAEQGPEGEGEAPDRYARFILESVCDSFEIVGDDGACHVRLVKLVGDSE
jgi:serine/threonine-protein kinase RsbW